MRCEKVANTYSFSGRQCGNKVKITHEHLNVCWSECSICLSVGDEYKSWWSCPVGVFQERPLLIGDATCPQAQDLVNTSATSAAYKRKSIQYQWFGWRHRNSLQCPEAPFFRFVSFLLPHSAGCLCLAFPPPS